MISIILIEQCYSITLAHQLLIIEDILQLLFLYLCINNKLELSIIDAVVGPRSSTVPVGIDDGSSFLSFVLDFSLR